MRSGNRAWIAQPQLMKFGRHGGGRHSLRFVYHQNNFPAGLAQLAGDDFVMRRQTCSGIDNKEDPVSLVDSLARLLGHFMQDALRRHRFEAAGIHHEVRFIAQPAVTIVAVSRQPGNVRDDGIPTAGQPVKKRRFPNVGATDQYKSGFHDWGICE